MQWCHFQTFSWLPPFWQRNPYLEVWCVRQTRAKSLWLGYTARTELDPTLLTLLYRWPHRALRALLHIIITPVQAGKHPWRDSDGPRLKILTFTSTVALGGKNHVSTNLNQTNSNLYQLSTSRCLICINLILSVVLDRYEYHYFIYEKTELR